MCRRDGTGDFEGTRNGDALPGGPGALNGGDRAGAQLVADVAIEAGFQDQDVA